MKHGCWLRNQKIHIIQHTFKHASGGSIHSFIHSDWSVHKPCADESCDIKTRVYDNPILHPQTYVCPITLTSFQLFELHFIIIFPVTLNIKSEILLHSVYCSWTRLTSETQENHDLNHRTTKTRERERVNLLLKPKLLLHPVLCSHDVTV